MTDTLPSNTAYELNPDALLAAYRTMRTIRDGDGALVVHHDAALGDGRVIVEGTPDEIRANETVHDLYLGRA